MKKTFKKYLVPHEENEYKPHFIREKSVFALLGVVLLLFFVSFFLKSFVLTSDNFASIISSVLVDLTNGDREANQVQPLVVSPVLALAAQKKADDMAIKGYFSHTSPEGLNPWHWFAVAGYNFSYAGENLAIDFSDSKDVEKAWMDSLKHRDNILNGNFTEIGIATTKGFYQGRETIFVVQMFGKPAFSPVPPAPSAVEVPPKKEIAVIPPPASVETNQAEPVLAEVAGQEIETIAEEDNFLAVKNTGLGQIEQENVAGTAVVNPPSDPYSSRLEKIAASPRNTLKYIYGFLVALVLIPLVLMIAIEMHKQSLRHMLYAFSLISIMALLIYLNQVFIYPEVMVR